MIITGGGNDTLDKDPS